MLADQNNQLLMITITADLYCILFLFQMSQDNTIFRDVTGPEYTLGTLDSTTPASDQHLLTGWFSHEGLHVAPAVQNVLSNMLLVRAGIDKRILTSNKPLPESLLDRVRDVCLGLYNTLNLRVANVKF